MSPENVERGRRLRPAKITRGVSGGGRLRSFSFRYALKRRRSACGSRELVK
jgi:hypothetical protein